MASAWLVMAVMRRCHICGCVMGAMFHTCCTKCGQYFCPDHGKDYVCSVCRGKDEVHAQPTTKK